MNLKDAIADPTVRKNVTTYLAKFYEEDIADDAWQEVALYCLTRTDSPVFETPDLARNYLVKAVKSRAIRLQNRQLADVAKSDLDVFGEDSKVNMVLDESPNPEEALEASQEDPEGYKAAAARLTSAEVWRTINTFPLAIQQSFHTLMEVKNKRARGNGGWTAALMQAEGLSKRQAEVRLQYLRTTYFPKLKHLRAVRGVRPLPS